jgi:uncharacterized protein YpbB
LDSRLIEGNEAALILLHLIDRFRGQRSLNSIIHFMNGEPSHQALWDAHLFRVTGWHGLFRHESKSFTENLLSGMLHRGWIEEGIQGKRKVVDLTSKGREWLIPLDLLNTVVDLPSYLSFPSDNLLARLFLCIQTLSHLLHDSRRFQPVVRDGATLNWMKSLLQSCDWKKESESFTHDLFSYLEQVPSIHREILIDRMSGYHHAGLTYHQLSERYQLPRFIIRSILQHGAKLLYEVWKTHGKEDRMWTGLFDDVIREWNERGRALTASAGESWKWLKDGVPLHEITRLRKIKLSTLHDHIIEILLFHQGWEAASYVPMEKLNPWIQAVTPYPYATLTELNSLLDNKKDYFLLRIAQILVWRRSYDRQIEAG